MNQKSLKSHSRIFILSWTLLYTSATAFGQTNLESKVLIRTQIEKAMSKFMSEQKGRCVSFHTSIKISFGKKGEIKNIQSADNLAFEEKEKLVTEIKKLDNVIFEDYAKEKRIFNTDMLVRMNMIAYSDGCTNNDSKVDGWKLADIYDGVPLRGLYYHFGTLTLRIQLENDRTFTN